MPAMRTFAFVLVILIGLVSLGVASGQSQVHKQIFFGGLEPDDGHGQSARHVGNVFQASKSGFVTELWGYAFYKNLPIMLLFYRAADGAPLAGAQFNCSFIATNILEAWVSCPLAEPIFVEAGQQFFVSQQHPASDPWPHGTWPIIRKYLLDSRNFGHTANGITAVTAFSTPDGSDPSNPTLPLGYIQLVPTDFSFVEGTRPVDLSTPIVVGSTCKSDILITSQATNSTNGSGVNGLNVVFTVTGLDELNQQVHQTCIGQTNTNGSASCTFQIDRLASTLGYTVQSTVSFASSPLTQFHLSSKMLPAAVVAYTGPRSASNAAVVEVSSTSSVVSSGSSVEFDVEFSIGGKIACVAKSDVTGSTKCWMAVPTQSGPFTLRTAVYGRQPGECEVYTGQIDSALEVIDLAAPMSRLSP